MSPETKVVKEERRARKQLESILKVKSEFPSVDSVSDEDKPGIEEGIDRLDREIADIEAWLELQPKRLDLVRSIQNIESEIESIERTLVAHASAPQDSMPAGMEDEMKARQVELKEELTKAKSELVDLYS